MCELKAYCFGFYGFETVNYGTHNLYHCDRDSISINVVYSFVTVDNRMSSYYLKTVFMFSKTVNDGTYIIHHLDRHLATIIVVLTVFADDHKRTHRKLKHNR